MVTVALADKLTVEVQLKQTVGPLRGAALGRLRSVMTVCFRPKADGHYRPLKIDEPRNGTRKRGGQYEAPMATATPMRNLSIP